VAIAIPIIRAIIRNISGPTAEIAARALAPIKRPTQTASMELNVAWSRSPIIIG
jgi:hypothetical protein